MPLFYADKIINTTSKTIFDLHKFFVNSFYTFIPKDHPMAPKLHWLSPSLGFAGHGQQAWIVGDTQSAS